MNGVTIPEALPDITPEQLADKLLLEGFSYGGDWMKTPDGKISYMRFQVIRHKTGAYVIENHLEQDVNGYYTRPVVKRLF